MSKCFVTTIRSIIKFGSLASLVILNILGCAGTTVNVIQALNPTSVAIKMPAHSVTLLFSNSTSLAEDSLVKAEEKTFEDSLTKELVAKGFIIESSQGGSIADFQMNVVLSDVKIGKMYLEKYGQKIYQADAIEYETWTISYDAPHGGNFGKIIKEVGSGQVSFMTTYIDKADGSKQTARYYGPSGNISQAARDIAEFTYKALINPPK
jgi:hypothetical protein